MEKVSGTKVMALALSLPTLEVMEKSCGGGSVRLCDHPDGRGCGFFGLGL